MLNKLIFLIIPILASGLTFIFCLKLTKDRYNFPLDLEQKLRGKRIFGENKTFKGPICMGFFTMIFGSLTYLILKKNLGIVISDFEASVYFLIIGLSYSLAELPNSFIKRQINIPAGNSPKSKVGKFMFKTADTFDSLIVVGLLYKTFFNIEVSTIIVAVLIGGLIHLATDRLMIKLSLKG